MSEATETECKASIPAMEDVQATSKCQDPTAVPPVGGMTSETSDLTSSESCSSGNTEIGNVKVENSSQGNHQTEAVKIQVVVDQRKVVRLPNVTLPCPEGVLIDVWKYLPSETKDVNVFLDYVYGKSSHEGGMLRVYPDVPGEQEIGVAYLHDGKRQTQILKMLVNQDPRKLWVRNDPPCGAPFLKDLDAKDSFRDAVVRFIAASRRGRSHEQSGTFRDDDFMFTFKSNEGVYLIAVADGAGSAKYSREGSRRAVQFVQDDLFPKLTGAVWAKGNASETKDGQVAQLLAVSAYKAMAKISAFCAEENQKPGSTEKYALKDFNTTLLVAAVRICEDGALNIVTFSIGDGAIAWVEPGKSELLCTPDGGEFSGQTRFLTTPSVWPKAESEWAAFRQSRVFVKSVPFESARQGFLVLMTDGVSDPFFETDAKLHDEKVWDDFVLKDADVDEGAKSLREILCETNEDAAAEKLMNWLGFWSRGNHDDRTLAMLSLVNPQGPFFETDGGTHAEER